MTESCSNHCCGEGPARRRRCPASGQDCARVSANTIKHHIAEPWHWDEKPQGYYFCDDPHCDVVYFGEDDSVIARSMLRTRVGIKEGSGQGLLCYCYGITFDEARRDPALQSFVLQETRSKSCACETRNPAGRCCLGDFARL